MKIGLFGQFGGGNSGNDGSLEAMVAFLRTAAPKAELFCICREPKQVESDYRIHAVTAGHPGPHRPLLRRFDTATAGSIRRILTLFHPFRQMRRIDVLIVPGTGFLDDYQEAPFGWPFMIFRWSLAAKLSGARLAFVSVGAGPVVNPVSRRFIKAAARMCHYRSYRDQESKQFMESIGSGFEKDPVFPDLAFRLPTATAEYDKGEGQIAVGLGVMSYSGWMRNGSNSSAISRNHLSKLSAFAVWLLEQGYHVRLLTGDSVDDPAVQQVRRRVISAVPDKAARQRLNVEPTQSLHELMRQISMTDIVVGTRFHNIVCALKMCKPVVSLGYAAKNDVLLDDFGLAGFSQHVENFDLEVLKNQFIKALANREEIQAKIAERIKRYEHSLAEQDRELTARFLIKPGRGRPPDSVGG